MNLYTIALFLHVSGAIGAFVSIGIWLFGLAALRRAQYVEQMRAIGWLIVISSPLMVFSVLLIAIAGLDMALSAWGLGTGWIVVALVSFVLIGPIGAFVLDPRMRTIVAMAREEPDGPRSDALDARAHDPVLSTGVQTLTTILLGIVFLMTTKPPLTNSIIVMIIALALGLVSGLPFWYAARTRAKSASARENGSNADPFQRETIWTRRW